MTQLNHTKLNHTKLNHTIAKDSLEDSFSHAPQIRNVIIIGSGPAGYTAALYTARAGLGPLLIAGNLDQSTARIKGGQLMWTSEVENYPGSTQGAIGPELMARMEEQALSFGAEMIEEFITEVDLCGQPSLYRVTTESGNTYQARSLIIATGASVRTLGLAAEARFFGQGGGVSTCAVCDGHFYKGKTVAVVGGGDTAMEEALYLSRLAAKVYLVHRSQTFRASQILLQRAQENPNIEFQLNQAIADIKGQPHPLAASLPLYREKEVVASVVLSDVQTQVTQELPVTGVFLAIGHNPNSGPFADQLERDDAGYLKPDKRLRAQASPHCSASQAVSFCCEAGVLPGVFVAGDVGDPLYRQAIIAAGSGAQAAIEAERYLNQSLA